MKGTNLYRNKTKVHFTVQIQNKCRIISLYRHENDICILSIHCYAIIIYSKSNLMVKLDFHNSNGLKRKEYIFLQRVNRW